MLCLFEDNRARDFLPLAATQHVAHLMVGTMTLRARAMRVTAERVVVLHGRRYLREYHAAGGDNVAQPQEPTLFVNARLPLSRTMMASFPNREQWIVESRCTVVAARLAPESIALLNWEPDALDFDVLERVPRYELVGDLPYEYLWDMIHDNGARIVADSADWQGAQRGTVMAGAHIVNPDSVTIGAGSVIKPGVVIDAESGPVIIGDDVEIMPNAVIEGPCYIGDHCRIKIGAKIYGNTSIGPWCKVGGEVENSIILGYSNKQHDGFLGHSYLGRWVNLGADTNTSDLKNNYGTIRVRIAGQEIDTGRTFVGSLIGDHAKTGINTMLNTGTVVGVGANVFGGGFPPKEIRAFAWGGSDEQRYRIDDAVNVAARVMERRKVILTPADEALLRRLHAESGISGG